MAAAPLPAKLAACRVLQERGVTITATLEADVVTVVNNYRKALEKTLPESEKEQVPEFVTAFLSKGGKFIPAPRTASVADLKRAVDDLDRRLRLRHFFGDDAASERSSRCKLPKTWEPPAHEGIALFSRRLLKTGKLRGEGHVQA